jgi:hypothetical protein
MRMAVDDTNTTAANAHLPARPLRRYAGEGSLE